MPASAGFLFVVKTLALFFCGGCGGGGGGGGGGIFYCRNLNVDTLHTFISGFCRTDGAALHVLFGGYGNISFIYSLPL